MKRIIILLLAMAVLITNINTVQATENINIVAGAEEVQATGTDTQTTADGLYDYVVQSDGTAMLTEYNGSETNITTPQTVTTDGITSYPVTIIGTNTFSQDKVAITITISEGVTAIGDYAFSNCENVTDIYLPHTLTYISSFPAFEYTNNLFAFHMNGNDKVFVSDGVLYSDYGTTLVAYPAMKTDMTFVAPSTVTKVLQLAFCNCQILQNLVFSENTVRFFWLSVCEPEKQINIYLKATDYSKITSGAIAYLASGSTLYVQTDALATTASSSGILESCSGTSIVSLESTPSAKVPATGISFADGSVTNAITLAVGDTYTLADKYLLAPVDTTDNVTWERTASSNGDYVATVDASTGLVTTNGTGTCTIVGTTDSGKSITLNLTVYQGIADLVINDNRTYPYDSASNVKYATLKVYPYNANNKTNITWSSSEKSVATVTVCDGAQASDEYYTNYGKIQVNGVGTTIITATLDDNGTIIQRSFTLTITKNLSDCTVTIPTQTYTGSVITPVVTVNNGSEVLKENQDYTLSYSASPVNAGTTTVTITAKAGSLYSGSVSKPFTINKATYDMTKLAWTNTNLSYNGRNQSVTLTGLPAGVTATYSGNTKKEAGKYTATATLKYDTANYNMANATPFSTTWYIRNNQNINFSCKNVSKSTITVPYGTEDFKLGGSAKTKLSYSGGSGKVATVDSKGKISIKGTGYTTITVTAKQTDTYYKKSVTLTIYVTPKKSVLTYLKSNKKSELTVKWGKDKRASGYQIQYSTSSKFTKNTTNIVIVDKNTTTDQKVKKLYKGKKYYVRVRAYKTVTVSGAGGKKYGKWSSAQTVKVRKN